MNKIKKISYFSLLGILGLGFVGSVVGAIYLSESQKNSSNIYFANFESYINPKLKSEIETNNNVVYKTYGTNEQLESQFDKNYDMAVPSTYIAAKMAKEGKLMKLDWSKLTNGKIADADAALNEFNPAVQSILKAYDLDGDGTIGGTNDNLLIYGVPYFLQDMVFGYKNTINEISQTSSWSDIFNYLIGLENQKNGNIIAIKDERSIYGISRLYHKNDNVNPIDDKNINDFLETYSYLKKLGNKIIFRSDSGDVLNNFANPDTSKGANFSILYNGDLVYAIQGGDQHSDNPDESINIVIPTNTLLALDMVVINKQTLANVENMYDVINKVCLDKDGWSKTNFEFIQYTPPLLSLYNEVTQQSYWTDQGVNTSIANKIVALLTVKDNNVDKLVEQPITNVQKSDMKIAFMETLG